MSALSENGWSSKWKKTFHSIHSDAGGPIIPYMTDRPSLFKSPIMALMKITPPALTKVCIRTSKCAHGSPLHKLSGEENFKESFSDKKKCNSNYEKILTNVGARAICVKFFQTFFSACILYFSSNIAKILMFFRLLPMRGGDSKSPFGVRQLTNWATLYNILLPHDSRGKKWWPITEIRPPLPEWSLFGC